MKINGNQVRVGMVLEHQGKLWRVSKTEHVKPGKGGAFAQIEMKDVVSGTKLNERFRATESVERARLEQHKMQYLYDDGESLIFMDNATYEQTSLPKDLVGDMLPWMQESMEVEIEMHEGNPIGVGLPEKVTCTITEADAVIKGQTVSSSYKPAKLDNGQTVMVPPFIETGTAIVVSTVDGTYVERA
jgi:elongation factor P